MTIPAQLLHADRDQLFRDRAVSITYRQLSRTVDAATATVSIETSDTTVEAVPGHLAGQPVDRTAARLAAVDLRLLVRAGDFTSPAPRVADRVLLDEQEYEILSIARWPVLGTVTLDCRHLA